MSDEETDNEALHTYNVSTMEVRANLRLAAATVREKQYFAISDGGADLCIVGENATVISHTGRYATLVGYDPTFTRSQKIPIVTAYLKVKAHNNIPMLLKINDAVFKKRS